MTNFTPPTEFPHECLDITGRKVILYAKSKDGLYITEIIDGDNTRLTYFAADNLCDAPKITSTWRNEYEEDVGMWQESRKLADSAITNIYGPRIGVLRRDIIDGKQTLTMEDV